METKSSSRVRVVNKHNVTLALVTLLMCLGVGEKGFAQQRKTPLLERTISIAFAGETLEASLKKLSRQGGFTFSYGSSLIDESEIVNATFTNRTVREILDHLFRGRIDYRERGKYIILIKAVQQTSSRAPQVLSGYVIDEATGERLKNVSVYDPETMSSAVTDDYGFFKIEIRKPTGDEIKLAVNKVQYTDTLVVVRDSDTGLLNIPIRFDKDKIRTLADSVGNKFTRMWNRALRASEEAVNMENISDTLYRTSQFSLVPFIGSNGGLSGNVINDYSFNVFGGYSLGNRKLEFAGLFNAIRGDVKGFQFAGLANGVMGKVNGFQFAGLGNLTGETVDGVQFAGLANVTFKNSTGAAFAGLGNVTGGSQRGVHAAGLFNVATESSGPAQLAGFFNLTEGDFSGAQLAGGVNVVTDNGRGAQVAGLVNISADSFTGVQVSGLLNLAKDFRGVQISFLNFSKTMRGMPIGFLSFVSKGYHKLEISADEVFYNNIAFRTGVRQFYNILTVGAKPDTYKGEQTLWTFGYGVGTAPKISKWLYLNFDLTSNQIVHGKIEKINLLNKLYTGLDFQITRNFSVTAGVTLNAQITDPQYVGYPEIFSDYTPNIVEERTFRDDLNMKMWWGGKIGVRFF